ncbi:MAG TPA: hypothetical protein VGD37_32960 [Kofleriaceae bacterium]|jgi:hypothetical protein
MKKLMFMVLFAAACGGSDSKTPDAAPPADAPIDTAPACFSGTPMTHNDLINACVDQSVTVIHKMPVLPLLNPDGTLPPPP